MDQQQEDKKHKHKPNHQMVRKSHQLPNIQILNICRKETEEWNETMPPKKIDEKCIQDIKGPIDKPRNQRKRPKNSYWLCTILVIMSYMAHIDHI